VLFELIGEPAEKASQYTFTSVEVKELSKTIDGVFVPTNKQSSIYFVEVQFQKDDNFYWRFITEIFIYLGQYKPQQEWQGVVIWGKRALAKPLSKEYQGLLAQKLIEIIYLDEISQRQSNSLGLGIIELVVGKEETAVEQVKLLTETAQKTIIDNSLRVAA